MDRRAFLVMSISTITALSVSGCPWIRRRDPVPNIPDSLPVIDVHSHVFNAADLPIKGFIEYVALSNFNPDGLKTFAAILVNAIGNFAPGYEQEKNRLDILLGSKLTKTVERAWEGEDEDRINAYKNRINEQINKLVVNEKDGRVLSDEKLFLNSLRQELGNGTKGLKDRDWYAESKAGIGQIARYIVWGGKLLRYRYQQVMDICQYYPRVDLFTPAIIDFDYWLDDKGKTEINAYLYQARVSVGQQMVLMQLINKWSKGLVRPYVAYDPLRDVINNKQSFDWVKNAIATQGAIGVKLYPPMGFVPLGNNELKFCHSNVQGLGQKLDEALLQLYKYCESKQIPIMAHYANSNINGRCEEYKTRAQSEGWARVLKECPDLHLNLGHFATHDLANNHWRDAVRTLMINCKHVYADISHVEELEDPVKVDEFFNALIVWLDAVPGKRELLLKRLMYGSDWIMVAKEKIGKDYYRRLVGKYGDYIGENARNEFVGPNAARFLGVIVVPRRSQTNCKLAVS